MNRSDRGAETRVKSEIAKAGWRLAFSRPGFVTAKHDGVADPPGGIFVRTASHSLGQLRGVDGDEQIAGLTRLLAERFAPGERFDQLHLWPRDRLPIGKFGFEPAVDEVSKLVAQQVHSLLAADWLRCDAPNTIAEPGHRVLDVVLVDPSHWFIGWHSAGDWPSRWPGGIQPIDPIDEPVSRAYFKAAEGITWSGFDMHPGDLVAEIGSAPGGACGRLLEMGFRVIGIDPAEMDERIADHPNFTHIRARAGDLPRKQFRDVRWLLLDSNVRPEKTLTTLENVVRHRHCQIEGLLVTLKLGSYDRAGDIASWLDRIRSWHPTEVRVRQLATNRCEVCVAVRFTRA